MNAGKYIIYCIGLLLSMVMGCTGHYYENIKTFDDGWHEDSVASFDFDISDASATYDIYYNVRNNMDYPYYNFYLKYTLIDVDKNETLRSSLQQIILMDPKTGKPYGKGFSDVFQHSFLGLNNVKFPHKGNYRLVIQQYMRQTTLNGILSIGVSIDKNKDKS